MVIFKKLVLGKKVFRQSQVAVPQITLEQKAQAFQREKGLVASFLPIKFIEIPVYLWSTFFIFSHLDIRITRRIRLH